MPTRNANRAHRTILIWLFLFCIMLQTPFCLAGNGDSTATLNYLKQLSIEQLAALEVTTASKQSEKLSDTAAAIFVIRSEDIHRGGFTSIPEALRMVPGLDVARIDANKWAISSRGFNAWFANKLLVLMDGRSVYTPLFSGVYWDVQDTFMDDIDRIEVIRGPGATLWGANAVNGVINIITKKARNTRGGLVNVGAGSQQAFGSARYGGRIGKDAWYRVYAKQFDRHCFENKHGENGGDGWHGGRTGFRADWNRSDQTAVTLQGDIYTGESGTASTFSLLDQTYTRYDTAALSGGNLLGRWTQTVSNDASFSVQVYYDRTVRDMQILSETRDTVDFDFQHTLRIGSRNNIIWGFGYRLTHDNISGSELMWFDPDSRTDNLFSAFIQDTITVLPERLYLTLGSKLEHNDYSGFEIQPSIRIRFKPHERQTLWAAVSRAVRTPSRADHDLHLLIDAFDTGATRNVVYLQGNGDFDSEEVTAYELGYRLIPWSFLSVDLASFYNVYHNLRAALPATPTPPWTTYPPPPKRIIPMELRNKFHENAYGLEVTGTLEIFDWWKASASYSWIQLHLFASETENSSNLELGEGSVPCNQFSIKNYFDLPGHLQLDTLFYYVDDLPDLGVPSYCRLDVRLGWRPVKNLELSLKLENLLEADHMEYSDIQGIQAAKIPRSIYGKVTWRF